MLKVCLDDITKTDAAVIINPANGTGLMDGGISLHIAQMGGFLNKTTKYIIEEEAKQLTYGSGGYRKGDCFVTSSGNLIKTGIIKIYHCVIFDFVGDRTELVTIKKALINTIDMAAENGDQNIAIPGLGIDGFRLSKSAVASAMLKVIGEYDNSFNISIIDSNPDFIEAVKKEMYINLRSNEELKNNRRKRKADKGMAF